MAETSYHTIASPEYSTIVETHKKDHKSMRLSVAMNIQGINNLKPCNQKKKRNKKSILILLRVMTSHRKSMMIKSCWELANIALVIVAINRK